MPDRVLKAFYKHNLTFYDIQDCENKILQFDNIMYSVKWGGGVRLYFLLFHGGGGHCNHILFGRMGWGVGHPKYG